MAFDIGIGGGKTARLNEPDRGQFPNNLGGAVSFSLASMIYKVLETMGGGIGAFLGGLGVEFLERIEPGLVDYVSPILDMVLANPRLEGHLRTFFEQLRHPQHEAGAAILGGLGQQVGGAVMGSMIGSLLAPVTQGINAQIRGALPDVSSMIGLYRYGAIAKSDYMYLMASSGFTDTLANAFLAGTVSLPDVGTLITALYRGIQTEGQVKAKLRKMAFEDGDIDVLIAAYRRYLDPQSLIQAWFRGKIGPETIRDVMSKQGYTDADITIMLESVRPIPGPSDLVRFGVREAYRDDVASLWSYDEDFPPQFAVDLAKWGFAPEWAKYFWRAHWDLPSVQMGYEMLHRGVIDQGTLQTLLKVSDIPAFWRDKLIKIGYTPYTRVDTRRMYKLGILSREQVKQAYRDIGYDETKAENMTEFTVRYETASGTSTVEEYEELTRSIVIDAFKKGLLTRGETTTRLMALGYVMDDINLLLELALWQKEVAVTPDFQTDYQKDMKSIIEKAYSRRVIGKSEAVGMLKDLGTGDQEAEYVLAAIDTFYMLESVNADVKAIGDAYVARVYDRTHALERLGRLGISGEMQDLLFGEWDRERNVRVRRLSEAQYRKAYDNQIIDQAEYEECMRALGYSDRDIEILVTLMIPPPFEETGEAA